MLIFSGSKQVISVLLFLLCYSAFLKAETQNRNQTTTGSLYSGALSLQILTSDSLCLSAKNFEYLSLIYDSDNLINFDELQEKSFAQCGCLCAAYILKHEAIDVPYKELLQNFEITEKGTSVWEIRKQLEKYGIKTSARKRQLKDLDTIIYPCIIHGIFTREISLPHFGLLLGRKEDRLIYLDSKHILLGENPVLIDKKALAEFWDGITIEIEY